MKKSKNKTMWAKKQLIMLSTNEKAKMWLNKFSNQLHIDTVEKENHENAINQHFYFLSDEEINGCDWYYYPATNTIRKAIKNSLGRLPKIVHDSKKIIATTDKSLTKIVHVFDFLSQESGEIEVPALPKPSQEFIEKFVEEYNKGNVVTEVMVAYDHFKTAGEGVVTRLQVNQLDNTINIKPCVH